MKYIIIIALVFVSFVLGWSLSTRYVSPKTPVTIPPKSMTEAEFAAKQQEELMKKKQSFITFIEATEKKYWTTTANVAPVVFANYLEDIVKYVFQDPDHLKFISFQFLTLNENLLTIKSQLVQKKTNNYSSLSNLIEIINSSGSELKQFSKQECKTYLNEQKDIWVFLRDLSNLSYSQYRSSPFFQRKIETTDMGLLDNDGTESQLSRMTDPGRYLNQRIISDIIFFANTDVMDLPGIGKAIDCQFSDPASRPMCEKLKVALKNKDTEFIRKKFTDNSRKYDLDSFYILYLIGDLTRDQLTDHLCLIK